MRITNHILKFMILTHIPLDLECPSLLNLPGRIIGLHENIVWHYFSWFSTLPLGSILTWAHLEQRFLDHFYSGENELKLSHLTLVKQQHDESVVDYIKRFGDTKN
jgi:hypothetical protein